MNGNKKVYRIRNGQGLYSKGGQWPTFNKRGKIWATRSALSNHLTLLNGKIPSDWVIEEFELVTTETKLNEMPASEYEKIKIEAKLVKINKEPDNKSAANYYKQRKTNELQRALDTLLKM